MATTTPGPLFGQALVWTVVNAALNNRPSDLVDSARMDPYATPGPQDSKNPRLFDATEPCLMQGAKGRGINNRRYFLELGKYIAAAEHAGSPTRRKKNETAEEFALRQWWHTAKYLVADISPADDQGFSIDDLNAIFEMGVWCRKYSGLEAWIDPFVCSLGDLILITSVANQNKAVVAIRSTISKVGELKDDAALNLSPVPGDIKGEVSLIAGPLNSVLGENVKTLWKVSRAQANDHDQKTHEAFEKARDGARGDLVRGDHVALAFESRPVVAMLENGSRFSLAKWSPNWDSGWVRIPDSATSRQTEILQEEINHLMDDPRTARFASLARIPMWMAAAWGALAFRDLKLSHSLAGSWGVDERWTLLHLFSGFPVFERMVEGPTIPEILTSSEGFRQGWRRAKRGGSRGSSRLLGFEAAGGTLGKVGPTIASLLFIAAACAFYGFLILGVLGWNSGPGYILWLILFVATFLGFLLYWRKARHRSGSGPRVLLIIVLALLLGVATLGATKLVHPHVDSAPITHVKAY